jgi:hypothetical protein
LILMLSQMNTAHNLTSYICKILFNIILHLRLGGLTPSRFPTRTLYVLPFHGRYMSFLFHSPWFHHCNNIWRTEIMKLLIFSSRLIFRPSCDQIFSRESRIPITSVYVLPLMWRTMFHTHTKLPATLWFSTVSCPL